MQHRLVSIVLFLFFMLTTTYFLLTTMPKSYAQTAAPTPTPDPCALLAAGDALCDGRIDSADFEVWRNEYLGHLLTKKADFNKDTKVNLVDFEIWRKGFKGE